MVDRSFVPGNLDSAISCPWEEDRVDHAAMGMRFRNFTPEFARRRVVRAPRMGEVGVATRNHMGRFSFRIPTRSRALCYLGTVLQEEDEGVR